jgi:S-adenosyl-L-methionine hydrolase (adenosine-forming)
LTCITLMTDFGIKDGNVGVMKGVIWRIAPQAQIADLSHLISPQNIPEAALILLRSAPYFPPGAIHLVVIDPGVGTTRRAMAALVGSQYFVGPDNGILTLWLESAAAQELETRFVELDRSEYWLPEVSHVFHGRDIFAPVAAHLARGVPLDKLGAPFADPVLLHLPQPVRTHSGFIGEIIHMDHFGNLSTNIRQEHLGQPENVTVRLGDAEIHGFVKTFGERPPGELVALYGSTGNLIVSVVNGSAAQRLDIRVGDPVQVEFEQ